MKDGLLPNLFPEGENEGLYHTADATMWFFHAVDRYLEHTEDEELLRDFYPTLARHHRAPPEGHALQHPRRPGGRAARARAQEGYQLTWMDAKVDGWVVTPRRGKAVEINALWFNALRLMAEWAERLGKDPAPYRGGGRAGLRELQPALLEPGRRAACSTWWTERTAKNDPAVRPEPDVRHLAAATRCCARDGGSRCWRRCARSC